MKLSLIKLRLYQVLPLLSIIVLILFENVSFNLFGFSQSYLTNVYAFIFFFAIFNTAVINIFTIFFLGILTDILLIFPLGLSVFLYCFVYFIGQFNQRSLRRGSFRAQWIIYSLTMLFVFLFGLLFLNLVYGHIPHFFYLLTEFLVLICFYPIIAVFCGWINRKMELS